MLSKDDLKRHGSDYYQPFDGTQIPLTYMVTKEDEGDPGKIAFKLQYPFTSWPLLMKFNNIVDPFNDLAAGQTILIPNRRDLVGL